MLDLQLGLDLGSYAAKRRPTPIDLFRSGEEGVWYEPADESTLFQDSAGTTPVTADGDPVGLMLDKSKGLALGPELIGTIDFTTGWALAGAASPSDVDTVVSSGPGGPYKSMLVVGRTYSITLDTTITGTTAAIINTPGQSATPIGGLGGLTRFIHTATNPNLYLRLAGAGTLDVHSFTVRELPGNHATQTVSAARPTYQRGDSRGVVNLLLWSEDFGDGVWLKTRSTVVSDATISPTGGSTADLLIPNTEDNEHNVRQTRPVNVGTETMTIYAKSAGFPWVGFRFNINGSWRNATFDLDTGTVGATTTGYDDVDIQSAGDGWFRCSATYTNRTDANLQIGVFGGNNDQSVAGDGTSGIYIWGAQLEEGSTATPYQRNDSHLGGVATGLSTDLRWLSFDGVDDYLATAAGVGISGSNNRELALSGTGSVVTINPLGGTGERWSFRPNNGANRARIEIQGSGHNSPLVSGLNVWGCRLDGPTLADNTLSVGTTEAAASGADAINTVDGPLSVGRININTFDPGEVYGLILLDRLLSVPDRTSTRNYLAKKAGVVL